MALGIGVSPFLAANKGTPLPRNKTILFTFLKSGVNRGPEHQAAAHDARVARPTIRV
jgi:hypothetical protein